MIDGVAGAAYTAGAQLALQQVPQQLQGGTTNTFTLTQNIDAGAAFTTSAPGAIYNALPFVTALGLANNTLNIGDTLTDNAKDGTLNFISTGGGIIGANPPFAVGVTTTGISTANVTGHSGVGPTGFSGLISGLKTINIMNSTDQVQIGGAGPGASGAGLLTLPTNINISNSGLNTGLLDEAVVVLVAQAAADLTKTINISLTGGNLGVAGTAFELVIANDTISGGTTAAPNNSYGTWAITAGSNAILELDQDNAEGVGGATALILSGAGKIAAGQDAAGDWQFLTSIDASANSGGVTIAGATVADPGGNVGLLAGNTALTSFKGGSGADLLDVSGDTLAQLGKFTALDGGAARDTIVVAGTINFNGAAIPDTNFEIMQVTAGLGGTVKWTNLGANIDTFQLIGNAAADTTFNAVPSGATVAFGTFSNDHSYTFNGPSGTTDVLNITDTGAPVTDFVNLTFNGFEVVNQTFSATSPGTPPVIVAGNVTLAPSPGGGAVWNLIDNTGAATGVDFEVFGTTNVTTNGLINITGSATATGAVRVPWCGHGTPDRCPHLWRQLVYGAAGGHKCDHHSRDGSG